MSKEIWDEQELREITARAFHQKLTETWNYKYRQAGCPCGNTQEGFDEWIEIQYEGYEPEDE